MVRKLTLKQWMSMIPLFLICGAMAAIMLIRYASSALEALMGSVPKLAETESMTNIYGITALGLFFVAVDVLIVIQQLSNSVGKKVRKDLNANSNVTQQQLDNDFAAAEQIDNIWIGRKWTFNHDMDCIPVENDKIVLVYSEKERVNKALNYYLCLGFVDGNVVRVNVSEDNLSHIMEVYGRYPHILVGNNPEYRNMFRNDLNTLLDLKYRNNQK